MCTDIIGLVRYNKNKDTMKSTVKDTLFNPKYDQNIQDLVKHNQRSSMQISSLIY